LIDGDFHSHSFGGSVKRNDSMVREELKYSKLSFVVEVDFTRTWDFTWMMSDCEELSL